MERNDELLRLLISLNIDKEKAEDLLGFLDFIDVPKNLYRLKAVLENVIPALERPLVAEIEASEQMKTLAAKYRHDAIFIFEKLPSDEGIFYSRPLETNVKRVMQNYITKHPIYVLLFMNSDQNQEFYKVVHQILLFLRPLVELKNADNHNIFLKSSDLIQINEHFRAFSVSEIMTQWYASIKEKSYYSLKEVVNLLDSFANSLEPDQLDSKSNNSVLSRLKTFTKFLKLGLGISCRRHNLANPERVRASRNPPTIDGYSALRADMLLELTLPDIYDDENLVYALWQSRADSLDFEALESGEDEKEQENGELLVFQSLIPLDSYVQAFHGKRVSNTLLNRLARQNNYLPLSLQILAPIELQSLLVAISKTEVCETELMYQITLLTMLFTSSHFERARGIVVAERFDDNKVPVQIGYEYSTESWIIPALDLKYKTPATHSSDNQSCKFLRLPATKLCQQKFQELTKFQSKPTTPTYLDNGSNSSYGEFIGYTQKIGTGSLTKGRISNHLLITSCGLFGQATSALLFNREPPGSMARSFYTSLDRTLLIQRYQDLLRTIANSVGSDYKPIWCYSKNAGWIGARYRPELLQVANAILQMQKDMVTLQNQLTERNGWILFHNLYLTYQVLCQSLLTGMRPMLTPLVQREHLVISEGILIRKEKTQEDEFNIRHIPICALVIELTDAYERHLLVVKSRLIRKSVTLDAISIMFYLDPDSGSLKKFKPSSYQEHLKQYIDLPANLNRRLLRNFLEEKSINYQIIDAMMGHANIGEQYWESYSTLSMREIRAQLASPLNAFAVKLGIRSLGGLAA